MGSECSCLGRQRNVRDLSDRHPYKGFGDRKDAKSSEWRKRLRISLSILSSFPNQTREARQRGFGAISVLNALSWLVCLPSPRGDLQWVLLTWSACGVVKKPDFRLSACTRVACEQISGICLSWLALYRVEVSFLLVQSCWSPWWARSFGNRNVILFSYHFIMLAAERGGLQRISPNSC